MQQNIQFLSQMSLLVYVSLSTSCHELVLYITSLKVKFEQSSNHMEHKRIELTLTHKTQPPFSPVYFNWTTFVIGYKRNGLASPFVMTARVKVVFVSQ